jgi:single stranded DNA-binding protein
MTSKFVQINSERWSFADVQLRGRAGQDSVLKYTASGKPILTFSLAINRGPKENRRTIWLSCKAFGDLAESSQVKKGDLVDVSGSLDISSWADKTTGQQRERVEILVNEISLHTKNGQDFVPRDALVGDDDDLQF